MKHLTVWIAVTAVEANSNTEACFQRYVHQPPEHNARTATAYYLTTTAYHIV
jgi:hypothetical protein